MRSKSKRNRPLAAAIPPPSTPSIESDYAFTLTRIAVAQICNSIGFTAAETPALRILTDIATRYLRSIAKSAADSANSAGRTQSNLVDTVASLEELSSVRGFPGAWKATGSFLNSGAVKEVASFSKYSEEIPFAKSLPRKIFSIGSCRGLKNVGSNKYYIGGERKHIPKWLPVMPVIEKEEEEEERGGKKGKEIWGFCSKTEEREREENGRGRKGIELPLPLPLKRGKVRFKIGSGGGGVLRVCRRGGIGKRVLRENWIFDDENQKNNNTEEQNEMMMMKNR